MEMEVTKIATEKMHSMQMESAQLQLDGIQSLLFDNPILSNAEKQVFICELRKMLDAAEERLRRESDRLFQFEGYEERMEHLREATARKYGDTRVTTIIPD